MILWMVMVCLLFSTRAAGEQDFFSRGLYLLKNKQFNRAIATFSKAIEANPNFAEAYNNRGVCRFYTGDLDRAIDDYTRAVQLNPDDAEALKNRGGAWFYQKSYDRAIADYTRALAINAEDAEAYYHRGVALFYTGEYRKSIADYTQALRIRPDYAAAYNQIAWTLATCPDAEIRDGSKAVAMAQKALAFHPEIEFLDTLAAAYAEAGRFDEAVAAQQKVILWLERKNRQAELPESRKHLKAYRARKTWLEAGPGQCSPERISAFIEAWRNSWENADIKAYLGFYHPDAIQGRLKGRERIAVHKKALWQREKPGEITFGPVRIVPDAGRCRVTFDQIYAGAGGYRDSGRKTVTLAPYGGSWLIVNESWRGR